MKAATRISRRGGAVRWALGAAAALGLASLGACAEDNPFDMLVEHVGQPIPGTNEPYPNLAVVPEKAPETMSKAERASMRQSLEADSNPTAPPPASIGTPPPIPPMPQSLPPGFTGAQSPMQVAAAAAPANPAGTAPATLAKGKPSFGALGQPDRVAIVLFLAGSDAIDPSQVELLKPLVKRLAAAGGHLQIVGYAAAGVSGSDTAADKVSTFNLSLRRAQAVSAALIRMGAPAGALILSAEGDSAPVASIAGVEGAAANDRVDIYLEN
ncbi:MAG TPA: OmpA family protein [Alphaproteobacteria bacterium]|nr:OmpA family protein [Alphaproteobacteria bacterium]